MPTEQAQKAVDVLRSEYNRRRTFRYYVNFVCNVRYIECRNGCFPFSKQCGEASHEQLEGIIWLQMELTELLYRHVVTVAFFPVLLFV